MNEKRRGSYEFSVRRIGASYYVVADPDDFTREHGWKPLRSKPFSTLAEAEANVYVYAKALLDAMQKEFGDAGAVLTRERT